MIMTRPGGAISDGGQEVYEASVNMEDTVTESPYCMELEPISRHRYKELINRYVGRDPYLMKMCEFSVDLKDLPTVEAVDITNYLVLQTSFYTKQQMKAYKSMEAYNFFVCGWVHNLGTKRLHDDNTLVFARVNHSQRSSKTPLKTWIIAKKDGEVIAAHCNCMAGYGCKHEAQARGAYEKLMGREHAGFSCMDSGLWLNPKWPYMGSSPDGIVACDCHGTGICEMKCPYSYQDEANLRLCAGRKGFCLINDGDHVMLDRSHDYYFQVQAQLHIVDAEYCDFVVWNRNDIFVERILPEFELWDDVLD
ncbi:uncharacterized protein LOC118564015 [Fundulus heteroclitus]|uniref:uncharacterized protein LOC118564015 n=1 Tax=Fundulus heteroclitus TaxID=8078 RepID=UPI00165C9055|nr:uncharacterized protein LOC118564015 [Fundulus heteroclitus]